MELNQFLASEADRLGVEGADTLPDPAALAGDINNMLATAGNFFLNDTRGQGEVARLAMDIVSDTVEAAY